jgi:hypothetical protein
MARIIVAATATTQDIRDEKGRWPPGVCGNPAGRPRGYTEFQKGCRDRSEKALAIIDDAFGSADLHHKRWAVNTILSYAWGKPESVRPDDDDAERDRPKTDVIELSKRIIFILGGAAEAAKAKAAGAENVAALLEAKVNKPCP